jgi:acetoin utilization deacetylase AcuC-like enzyme
MTSALIAVRQRAGADEPAWTLDRSGARIEARDGERRLAAIEAGLRRHPDVDVAAADAGDDEIDAVLSAIHDADYLAFLAEASRSAEADAPLLAADRAEPGVVPDTPVCRGSFESAREAVRTTVAAARRVAQGAPCAYAVCRPPGHHAGPGWMGGYCYLNNAAAALETFRGHGVHRVGVIDLDLHYGNGTAALLARHAGVPFRSVHASTITHFPWRPVRPLAPSHGLHAFERAPAEAAWLDRVRDAVSGVAAGCAALVLSIGFDVVGGDPHGDWHLRPAALRSVGAIVRAAGAPACVVQEGGYATRVLARCAHAFAAGIADGYGKGRR